MTYAEAIDFLYNLRVFGTKLGLENTRELARLNGNPQDFLRFIHVAGTNGKGSTCAILESIYRAQGLRTGLFTSPHLVSFTERMQVNRIPIPETDVCRLTDGIIRSLGGPQKELWTFCPTFFEFVTIMALIYFREQNCDLVIWETGMGGRLDATNIVSPIAAVITNIQLDHQQWLGNSVEQIAAEKAGIIKPGVPIITGTEPGPAREVIRRVAEQKSSPLIIVENPTAVQEELSNLPLLGTHQLSNANLALSVVTTLTPLIPVSSQAIRSGIQRVQWAGRLQLLRRGESIILLDGAHNPDGMRTLASAITAKFSGQELTLVLGLFRDKAWREMCNLVVPLAKRLLLVPVSSERTADANEVQQYCQTHWPKLEMQKCGSLGEAVQKAERDAFIVIAGSLHLVGEAMELLGVSPSTRSERSLNEWDAAKTANA